MPEKTYWIAVADTKYSYTGLVYFSEDKADVFSKAEEFAKLISPDVISKHDGEQWWLAESSNEAIIAIVQATPAEVFEQCKEFLDMQRRNKIL